MEFEVTTNVYIDVDEVFDEMDDQDKEEMYDLLREYFDKEPKARALSFQDMNAYDQKKFLCDALDVPSYHDSNALREKLETIINAN